MTDEKFKTRAMMEDALKAHHRKLFMIDLAFYAGLILIGCLVVLSVWG